LSLEIVGEEGANGNAMPELPRPEEIGRIGKDCCPESRAEESDVDRAPFALPKGLLLSVGEALGTEYVNLGESETKVTPFWLDIGGC
jgi:hypothetical protein